MNRKNNGRNALHKYDIRGFKRRLPSSVDVAVYTIIFYVLLLTWFFEDKRKTTIKVKFSRESAEQNNCGEYPRKYAIRGF